jgi:hypothetical protein
MVMTEKWNSNGGRSGNWSSSGFSFSKKKEQKIIVDLHPFFRTCCKQTNQCSSIYGPKYWW